LQRTLSQPTPSKSQALTVPQPVIRVASPLSSVVVSQSCVPSAALQPMCARVQQQHQQQQPPAVSATTPLLWNTNSSSPVVAGSIVVQVNDLSVSVVFVVYLCMESSLYSAVRYYYKYQCLPTHPGSEHANKGSLYATS